MHQSISDLAVFERLTSISRADSVYELLWHLDFEICGAKTVVNVLFRNVRTGEYITDEIAPEYLGYCSVGSYFKGGKKQEGHSPNGIIRNITIDVTENHGFRTIDSVISDTEYDLRCIRKDKDERGDSTLAYLCKKQRCMDFTEGANRIVIPCSVIAATYYLTSHSMRTQLFAQNLKGLYEDIHYDEFTETALAILHRNARTDDAKWIVRFALSDHARHCWDNVVNALRSSTFVSKNGRSYSKLIAKIPVVQQKLPMTVRCHEVPNTQGGKTVLVHEILEESSDLPVKFLFVAHRGNAPPGENTRVIKELDAKPDGKLTNRRPSRAYKGHFVDQFNVPDNPIWRKVNFFKLTLPPRNETAQFKIVTELLENVTVTLSSQRGKGNDPNNCVARASLEKIPPRQDTIQRITLSDFKDMVTGLDAMEGISGLYISPELTVPRKEQQWRDRLTLRESYDKSPRHRRQYMYVSFKFREMFVCLVEMNQFGLSTRIGTYVLVRTCFLGEEEARQAAEDFVHESSVTKMEAEWLKRGVVFLTKSHPPKQAQELWASWRNRLLEVISENSI